MEKKYVTTVDVNTGVEVTREYTDEEYAQAEIDAETLSALPGAPSNPS